MFLGMGDIATITIYIVPVKFFYLIHLTTNLVVFRFITITEAFFTAKMFSGLINISFRSSLSIPVLISRMRQLGGINFGCKKQNLYQNRGRTD